MRIRNVELFVTRLASPADRHNLDRHSGVPGLGRFLKRVKSELEGLGHYTGRFSEPHGDRFHLGAPLFYALFLDGARTGEGPKAGK